MSDPRLSRERLLEALAGVTRILVEKEISARLYIVGGAAMSLQYDARDATRDIDARYYPKEAVADAALQVARECGLPADWLNDEAAMFISPVIDDENPTLIMSKGAVTIHVASAKVLLAMKIRASRPGRDVPDIKFLCKFLELKSVAQAIKVFESYYPEDPLPNRALPILQSIFPEDGDTSFSLQNSNLHLTTGKQTQKRPFPSPDEGIDL